jgi:hypothetical protein
MLDPTYAPRAMAAPESTPAPVSSPLTATANQRGKFIPNHNRTGVLFLFLRIQPKTRFNLQVVDSISQGTCATCQVSSLYKSFQQPPLGHSILHRYLPRESPPSPSFHEAARAPPPGLGGPLELLGAALTQALVREALEHPSMALFPRRDATACASSPPPTDNQGSLKLDPIIFMVP